MTPTSTDPAEPADPLREPGSFTPAGGATVYLVERPDGRRALLDLAVEPAGPWSGGRRRSAQLAEAFLASGCRLSLAAPAGPRRRRDVVAAGLREWARRGAYRPLGVDSLRSSGALRMKWDRLLADHPECGAVVLEGCGYGALSALPLLADRGVRPIAVPVNVEALAPYDRAPRGGAGAEPPWTHRLPLPARWREELRWWPHAARIFTISAEEAWLLGLHGVEADRLPYYPIAAHRRELAALAARRAPDPAAGYVYFGDFRNAPNLLGLTRLLDDLRGGRVRLDGPLRVVGRGSDGLPADLRAAAPAGVRFEGELGDAALDDLLATCVAAVLQHPATSGTCTRAVELNLACVPVLANAMALKGEAAAGFANWSLGPDRAGPPAIAARIPPPDAAVRRFLAAVWNEDG